MGRRQRATAGRTATASGAEPIAAEAIAAEAIGAEASGAEVIGAEAILTGVVRLRAVAEACGLRGLTTRALMAGRRLVRSVRLGA